MSSLSLPELLDGGGLSDSRPCSRGSIASMPMPQPSYTDLSPRYTAPMRTGRPSSKLTAIQRGCYKLSRHYSPRNYDVRARYSARFRRKSACENRLTANSPFLPKSDPEHCLKCMLKVSHRKCESHKYIRVGGGYRHSYWYLKCLMEELERQRQQEIIIRQRLAAISEKSKGKKLRAIKTYVRTKSGRLVEKIIYLDEEDYEQFKSGGVDQKDILSKYLSQDEVAGLQSWDQDEVKAVKMMVRTKSGKLIEKIVYVSKDEYDALQSGNVDAKELLAKYAKPEDGETVEGWGEAEMKTITTYVRTKSGRVIEKTLMISKEDYDAMIKEGKDPAEILAKYSALGEGETLDSWKSVPEPTMKAIKTKVRTKSGRIIEKTVYISQDDYDTMMKEGGDPNAILAKYLGMKEGETLETWEKTEANPMKVIKTLVRTKSGRLIEKTVMLTEDEYRQFEESGGNPDFLKKFLGLKEGESIDKWEKASTVYEGSDDEEMVKAKEGQRIVGKDGTVYEVVVDPITGKKYKKKVGLPESDVDSGVASVGRKKKGGRGKRGGKGSDDDDGEDETPKERARRKVGKRDARSDSEYSYKSDVSVGGTRRVKRRRKKADGTYSASESYHSSQDEGGQARRRRRRRERNHGSESDHSYHSVLSAGGTRHVKRRRKKADGTYSASESYHSSDSGKEGGGKYKDKKKKKKKERREHGSESDYSYTSEVSAGGTKTRKRTKRIKDEHGKVIGHGKEEAYSSPSGSDSNYSSYAEVSDGKGGKIFVKKEKPSKTKKVAEQKKAAQLAEQKKAAQLAEQKKAAQVSEQKKAAQLAKARARRGSKPVFSDASTESDDVDLTNMTEEEKKKYFAEKAKRKEEREERRRAKYGDSYDEMVALNEQKKKDKKELMAEDEEKRNPKSMVTYGKGKGRDTGPIEKTDAREPGMGHADWGGKKKKWPGADGNEADDESDEEDPITGMRRKKKKGSARGSEASDYEYTYDKEGKVIGKKRVKGKKGDDDELSEYEYEYDKDGNVIGEKKVTGKGARIGSGSSTGDFEKGKDGKLILKAGKKKIDLSKLTDEDLRNLGIDPTLSKAEIAKLLKQKFGDDIKITTGDQKVGIKGIEEYDSDVGTDELADDSDLDVDTLKGQRRVKIKMKRGGQALIDHMKLVMDMSKLQDDDYAKDLDERGDIDFLSHYRLVDTGKLDGYARAFVCEDDDFDTVIDSKETRIAMDGVPGMQAMTSKQMEYVLRVLKIDDASQVTFKMFAVISALCERVNNMDPLSKHLLEICDLLDIERKMGLYRLMFYQNTTSDRDSNFITAESLKIELIAGGLNWTQQQYIMERLQPTSYFEISFLDYLCYIPLFLSMHDNICLDPLDMSDKKYSRKLRRPSGEAIQRDMNPVGFPMNRESSYMLRKQAQDLLEGKIDPNSLKKEKLDLLNKYSKLPNILERPPSREDTPKMVWNF